MSERFRGTQAELADRFVYAAERARIYSYTNPAQAWSVIAYEAAAELVRNAIIEEPKS